MKIVLLFCITFTCLFPISVQAQTTITIGNTASSVSTEKYPFNNPWDYSWSNNIYLSTEIGQAGQITAVAFDVTSVASGYFINNQKIYVRHTTANGYTTTGYPGTSGYTLVFSGDLTYSGTGWKTITLTTPFSYNGTDNLEFLFENRDGSYNNIGFPYYRYTSGQSTNRVRRDYNDVTFPSTCVYCGQFANLLNIRLTMVTACTTTLTVTPTSTTICNGNSTTLTASGVSTYSWVPSSGLSSVTGSSVVASPTTSTTYTVYGKDASNCTQTKTAVVTVNPLPTITTNPSSPSVCIGESVTITASGASTYAWAPSTGLNTTTGATVIANPTTTTNYTITGTSSSGCVNTKVVTVTVNSLPSVLITPSSPAICNGSSQLLTASGASAYSWNTGATTTSITVSPTVTTSYTVRATNANANECISSATATVTVNPLPNVVVSPASATFCIGGNTTLTASGASTYFWAPATGLSSTTGATVIASHTATLTYTVTGTDANGCTKTKTVVVTVNSLPTVSISPSSATICNGTSTTLTASGATTYAWAPSTGLNTTTGATVVANPASTITYTVTGTDANGCTNTKTLTVQVNTSPTVNVNPTSSTVCNGSSTTLTASGATSYSWSPSTGLNTTVGATVIATPASNITYTVTGTTAGCSAAATSVVSVSSLAAGIATATGGSNTCNNSQVVLWLSGLTNVTIGTGTTTTERYPFNGPWDYSWSNVVYLQSELGTAGSITQLSFYVGNTHTAGYTMNNQYIYIKHTSSGSFSTSTYPGTSGYTQAFYGTITYSGVPGWKTITLDTPFNYDGVNNLDILYENRDGSYVNIGFPVFRYTALGGALRVRRDFKDGSFPAVCDSSTYCAAFANVLNTMFTKSGGSFSGTFVKWQHSTNNLNYVDLPGGTTQPYTTTAATSTYYRAEVTGGSCPSAYSSPALYKTNNNYYVNDNSTTGDVFTTAIGTAGNDGRDPSRPKASISDVFATYSVTACDTIFVDKGTYTDEMNITNGSDGGSAQGHVVVYGAGIDKSVWNAPANKYNVYLYQSHYFKVERFTMNSTQASFNNVNIYRSNYNIISNNKITHTANTNISLFGDSVRANHNQIISNLITNSSTTGKGILITGNSDTLTVDGDTILMTNVVSQEAILAITAYDGRYVYFPHFSTVNQNTISAYSYGIRLLGTHYPISSYTISFNKITMLSKATADGAAINLAGVGASSSMKSLLFNNRLIGGKNGIYMGSNVNYEMIYNNYISGSDYGLYVAATNSSIGELYFNSFYNDISNLFYSSYSFGYWKVKDNILHTTNNSAANACIDAATGSGSTFAACDYNLYYAPNGASIARFNSTNYATLAAWKAVDHADETPLGDENSISGDPQYVNAGANNLDITTSSPVIAGGVSISGITTDIYNTARFNPPTIGAMDLAPVPIITAFPSSTICSGQSVTLTAIGGISYSWYSSGATTASIVVSPVSSTSYTVLVTYTGGYSTTASRTITVLPSPVANAGADLTVLAGSSTTIGGSPSATSGTPPYSYLWTPSTALNSTTTPNPVSTTASTISYVLTVTDANGCSHSDGITLSTVSSTTVPFASLKKKLDGGFYNTINSILYFKFDEEYNDANALLNYKIYNDSHQLMSGLYARPVIYGDNRFLVNFSTQCSGYYILEVTNEKNESWYLRFKNISNSPPCF